jgi:hypothetical protein
MEYKELNLSNLYPQLPTAPAIETSAHAYRLQKICEIQKEIERERDKRSALSKKYRRSVNILNVVDDTLVAATMGLGICGIGVLSTIIAAPITIAMEGAALGAGALSVIGHQINKKLKLKAEKHEKIKTLADAKLNTISDHVSKALRDDQISDEEYSLILSELEKFNDMKEVTRSKLKLGIDEETKKSFINQGREDAIRSFRNMFEKSNVNV